MLSPIPRISEFLTNAMSPITANLKRRSQETQSSAKRTKLSAAPMNRCEALETAAQNIAKADSLTSLEFTKSYIPEDKQTFTTKDGAQTYTCTFLRTQDLSPTEMEACFNIVKETSQSDYESHAAEGWDDNHKKEEMDEEDMRFILVRQTASQKDVEAGFDTPTHQTNPILGFTSFKLELDPDNSIPQLYIYEIHLLPSLRGLGLGKHLMSLNECIAKNVGLEKCILTVFTCNEGAEGMYRKLGYGEDECCPKSRRLRGGKVRRPKYLILSKGL